MTQPQSPSHAQTSLEFLKPLSPLHGHPRTNGLHFLPLRKLSLSPPSSSGPSALLSFIPKLLRSGCTHNPSPPISRELTPELP